MILDSNPFRYCCASESFAHENAQEAYITTPQEVVRNIEQLWEEIESLKKDMERLQNQKNRN